MRVKIKWGEILLGAIALALSMKVVLWMRNEKVVKN
jgi:hypothetical protein